MEMISTIPLIGPALGVLVPFLIMLGVVIYVHEMGHYLVGRWCGIHAEVFSLGLGKELWSRTDKHGTKWRIAAFPIGGYVKFLGDTNASSFPTAEDEAQEGELEAEAVSLADDHADEVLADGVLETVSEEQFYDDDPENGSDEDEEPTVEPMSEEDWARSFPGASVLSRALTVAAGPVTNFILSAVIFTGLFLWQGIALPGSVIGDVIEVEGKDFVLRSGDKVLAVEGTEVETFSDVISYAYALETPRPVGLRIERNNVEMDVEIPFPIHPLVTAVNPLTPASRAGLKKGDYILSAAGEELAAFSDLQRIVLASESTDIELLLLRDGAEMSVQITPLEQDHLETNAETSERNFTRRVMIGISGGSVYSRATYTPDILTATKLGTYRVWEVISNSFFAIESMIRGDVSPRAIQGPIGMAQVSGEMFKFGLFEFITLIGFISTGIGLLNLFPIPILDGGHLVIFLYEAIRGKQPPEAVLRIAMTIGLGLILLLMLFATYNDVMRNFETS